MYAKSKRGRGPSELSRLYREFATFYAAQRCPDAPANPRRLFHLGFKAVYPEFKGRLNLPEFLSVMYRTLGVRGGKPRGPFQTFDAAEYHGKLAIEDHFAGFFKQGLVEDLRDELARTGRRPDPERLRRLSWQERTLLARLPAALAWLREDKAQALRLKFWGGYSARGIGEALGLDHKTVGKRLDRAVTRLREFFLAA